MCTELMDEGRNIYSGNPIMISGPPITHFLEVHPFMTKVVNLNSIQKVKLVSVRSSLRGGKFYISGSCMIPVKKDIVFDFFIFCSEHW